MADVSVTRKGMITDLNTINFQGTQYSFALNAVVESNSEDSNLTTIQNE